MAGQQPLNKPGQPKTASMARLYQSVNAQSPERATRGSVGPSAPKLSAQKSPGKSFKHARNTQSGSQMTTLMGSGVRKQISTNVAKTMGSVV